MPYGNQQMYNKVFYPMRNIIETRACITNILSVVENPFPNPDWFIEIISNSFDKKVNLVLIIDVKSFPRQLMRVIAR
jgi:hypothetical protein